MVRGSWPMLRKKSVFHGHWTDCNWVCTRMQVGQEVNTIIGDLMGWQNSKSIGLSSSDDPIQVRWSVPIGWSVPCECNTRTCACTIHTVVGIVKIVVIHGEYRCSEVNKSIGDSSLNGWQVVVQTSSKRGKLWLKLNLTLKVKVNQPQNNRDLRCTKMHFWFKFGDFYLNEWKKEIRVDKVQMR